MAILFTIQRDGRAFQARADGEPAFFVGFQTSFTDKSSGQHFEGLFNVPSSRLQKLVYAPDEVRGTFGFWADFISPTAQCEGGNYLTLNTYDRARFTWGFGQFAAHVPDGDFVGFLRALLQTPEALDYFPDLDIQSGRITKVDGGTSVPLESASSTQPLMDYLNPSSTAVEDAEVLAAAKLMHWTARIPGARALQAQHMVTVFKGHMRQADRFLGLDGRTADICCVISDILHQGRAKFSAMQAALNTANPLQELLKLGSISYPDRIATLKKGLVNAGTLFTGKTWKRASQDFV